MKVPVFAVMLLLSAPPLFTRHLYSRQLCICFCFLLSLMYSQWDLNFLLGSRDLLLVRAMYKWIHYVFAVIL